MARPAGSAVPEFETAAASLAGAARAQQPDGLVSRGGAATRPAGVPASSSGCCSRRLCAGRPIPPAKRLPAAWFPTRPQVPPPVAVALSLHVRQHAGALVTGTRLTSDHDHCPGQQRGQHATAGPSPSPAPPPPPPPPPPHHPHTHTHFRLAAAEPPLLLNPTFQPACPPPTLSRLSCIHPSSVNRTANPYLASDPFATPVALPAAFCTATSRCYSCACFETKSGRKTTAFAKRGWGARVWWQKQARKTAIPGAGGGRRPGGLWVAVMAPSLLVLLICVAEGTGRRHSLVVPHHAL